ANGQVWLINQNGFVFNGSGAGGSINVGGLVVSTAGIANAEGAGFMTNPTNTYSFNLPGNVGATITIQDHVNIQASGPGYVALQAPGITINDHNTIGTQAGGTIAIAAGNTFTMTVDPVGDNLISYQVNDPVTLANKIANGLSSAI